jgi:hypothetical protein
MLGHFVFGVTILTIVPSITWARSNEIPKLDVRPVCRGIASQSADPGVGQRNQTETFQQCMESEQAVREQLKREWSAFSAADKRHCVTLATTGGESSNTELLTCLEMARDVRVLRSATAAASERETTKPASSPSVPTAQPATTEPILKPNSDKEALKTEDAKSEVERAKLEAQTAKASEALAERKLADAEAALKRAKEEAGRATKEAEQAKAEAQGARDSEAAVKNKLADAEAAKAKAEQACHSGDATRPGLGGRLRRWLGRPGTLNH